MDTRQQGMGRRDAPKMPTIDLRMGLRIRREREAAGMSRQQLADKLGVPLRRLGSLERGERVATIAEIRALVHQFNRGYAFWALDDEGDHVAAPSSSK
jgi:transcriptional regulator with XRE-family HTH domain